jgi:hypothetical protein
MLTIAPLYAAAGFFAPLQRKEGAIQSDVEEQ